MDSTEIINHDHIPALLGSLLSHLKQAAVFLCAELASKQVAG